MPRPLLSHTSTQMAYVTNDIDRAAALWGEHYGIDSFMTLRDFTFAVGPGRTAIQHLALAYAGGAQIELIQPVSGDADPWRIGLTADPAFQMVFHHECQRCDTEAQLRAAQAEHLRRNIPILAQGATADSVLYFYADHRPTLGHLVEYIYFPPDFFAALDAAIPRW